MSCMGVFPTQRVYINLLLVFRGSYHEGHEGPAKTINLLKAGTRIKL